MTVADRVLQTLLAVSRPGARNGFIIPQLTTSAAEIWHTF
jgi:hypothetical protein